MDWLCTYYDPDLGENLTVRMKANAAQEAKQIVMREYGVEQVNAVPAPNVTASRESKKPQDFHFEMSQESEQIDEEAKPGKAGLLSAQEQSRKRTMPQSQNPIEAKRVERDPSPVRPIQSSEAQALERRTTTPSPLVETAAAAKQQVLPSVQFSRRMDPSSVKLQMKPPVLPAWTSAITSTIPAKPRNVIPPPRVTLPPEPNVVIGPEVTAPVNETAVARSQQLAETTPQAPKPQQPPPAVAKPQQRQQAPVAAPQTQPPAPQPQAAIIPAPDSVSQAQQPASAPPQMQAPKPQPPVIVAAPKPQTQQSARKPQPAAAVAAPKPQPPPPALASPKPQAQLAPKPQPPAAVATALKPPTPTPQTHVAAPKPPAPTVPPQPPQAPVSAPKPQTPVVINAPNSQPAPTATSVSDGAKPPPPTFPPPQVLPPPAKPVHAPEKINHVTKKIGERFPIESSIPPPAAAASEATTTTTTTTTTPPPLLPRRINLQAQFSPIPTKFSIKDSEFFGSSHLDKDANVIMTGVFDPEDRAIRGRWYKCSSASSTTTTTSQPFFYSVVKETNCHACKRHLPKRDVVQCPNCDFAYHANCAPKPSVCMACGGKQSDLPPLDRNWTGAFEVLDDPNKPPNEVDDDVHLTFTLLPRQQQQQHHLATIQGKGRNEYGQYVISGVLLPKLRGEFPLQLSRRYIPKE